MERRKRIAEKRVSVDVPKGSLQNTVGLVVRIHAGRHASDDIKKTLRSYGLNKKYDAIFMHLDKDCIRKLKPYDAYVAYGYVSKAPVEELMQRRAYTSAISGQKHVLSDNMLIEKSNNEYYLAEHSTLFEIFETSIEKFIIPQTIERIKEYLDELEK